MENFGTIWDNHVPGPPPAPNIHEGAGPNVVPEGDDSIQAHEGAPIPPAPDPGRCHFCWYPKGAVKWIDKPLQN